MNTHFRRKKIAGAIALALLSSPLALAQETAQTGQDQAIEEVVATGSRLQGSAAAVIEERKNQAFVADILGAEQLSRTGDSDAASALRRVTGLTLVDGKFIYVRGLGERYSSARLNGANIPSPDLTRNVIPLDIFPSSIIESMAVQKAYSPSMPAAFGGGNIDIRTKGVPTEFTAGLEVGVGKDSNSGSGFTYKRNDEGIPQALQQGVVKYRGDFTLRGIVEKDGLKDSATATRAAQALQINNQLLKSLPRNVALQDESLDPKYNIKAHIGDSFGESLLGGQIGVFAALSYDNSWNYSERKTGVIAETVTDSCSTGLATAAEAQASCYNTVKDSKVTTETLRKNGVFNLGYKLDQNEVSYSKMYLSDTEDETDISILQSPNASTIKTIMGTGQAVRTHNFEYQERTLDIDQFKGQHTFLDYGGIGFDWQYTQSVAETEIPTDVSYSFEDFYSGNGAYQRSAITGDDNRISYSYVTMEDHVKSYSGNLNLPVSLGKYEMEFKAGYDFSDKARMYNTSTFAVNNTTGVALTVNDKADGILGMTNYLNDTFIGNNAMLVDFREPTAPDADDYLAAQKIDALYGEFDVIYDNLLRISGGVRYEDFRQVSIGTSSLIFSREQMDIYYNSERIANGSINKDQFYPALSMTYLGGESYQVRLGYGQTVVRPDLREVVPVVYFDPLTDIRTIGRTGLKSSDIKNYDARFEYYFENGDNVSVAAFYKDITAPIETVLSVGDTEYTATFINGDTGKIYGVEAEWLYDLSWVQSGIYSSGNVTLSDSEVSIDPSLAGSLTNPTKRLTGHSKYVVNLQLNYDSDNGEHTSSLVYNIFGERILASGVAGRQDAFEQPFNSLDFVYTWYPDFNSKVKFKVQNLLGETQEVTQSDVIVRSKEIGTGFSLSYSYDF
ncbi:MAG: TonB-dependent receptor plug domain-containing protein [Gammaproteobacteria bacterium]|nr:TonB-dependent receptor plug domain-containing protein [Gammaproteobacteria bacterium]